MPRKNRSDGEGSVFQRGDGWVAQVSIRDREGKRHRITRSAATQNEARKLLTKLKGKQDSHTLIIGGRGTLRDWLNEWLELFIKPNRAPKTYKSYHDLLKQHVPENVGSIPLSRVAQQPETFQALFVSIAQDGLGRTSQLLRAVLRSSLNRAVKLKRLESNPILGTDAVGFVSGETAVFSGEQGKQFLKTAEGERLGALFVTALSLGLRKGELTGLREEDLDLEGRTIEVRRQLQWIKLPGDEEGRWVERAPKKGSQRTLPITETIYRFVIRHLAQRNAEALAAGESWKDSGYLFVSPNGAPLHERNISEAFHLACDHAGVPRIRFHDTRHSCGTLLHLQGADPFIIQKVLGHSQLSTTRRYTHTPIEVTRPALARLESLFDSTEKESEKTLVANSVANRPKVIKSN
uniref:Phage integrase family protein n=1 Tax=Solibacter usitatus (strain Ellin6076) TaxID=234267 RepID=Q01TT5_SOLUE